MFSKFHITVKYDTYVLLTVKFRNFDLSLYCFHGIHCLDSFFLHVNGDIFCSYYIYPINSACSYKCTARSFPENIAQAHTALPLSHLRNPGKILEKSYKYSWINHKNWNVLVVQQSVCLLDGSSATHFAQPHSLVKGANMVSYVRCQIEGPAPCDS